MAENQQTFSESWYRIAGQRICLRSGVHVRRQLFRGQRWIVLENPFSNQFYRMGPAAYEFVARLRHDRTVQEAWNECVDRFPDEAPGQEACLQLLAQLYFANLLQYDLATDTTSLFDRFEKNRQREVRARLSNIMFMRIPLFDPDDFLVSIMPWIKWLIGPIGAVLWFLVVGAGVKVAFDHWTELKDHSQGVLESSNLLLLYAGLVLVKTLHEFGHAAFCRRLGGEVHVMGVLFMIFTPVPFMDATSSWAFRSRWHRALVGAAGMIVELFVAAIAIFIWARTGPGVLHNLMYNMVFVSSVSTVVFNINPLLRYDGYYILTDLIEMPNLYQHSMQHLRHLVERYAFGIKRSESPARNRREYAWLTVYGILGGAYRLVVFAGVLLFVADRMLLLGLIMAVFCFISWVIVPIVGLFKYLGSSPRLERNRRRAIAVTAGAAAVLLLCLWVVPFPHHFRAAGMLQSREWSEIVNDTAGQMDRLFVESGATVKRGQPLMQLSNSELDNELAASRSSLIENQNRLRQAMGQDPASIRPMNARINAVQMRLNRLEADKEALTVRARQDGIFVSPTIRDSLGRWLVRGSALGLVVNPSGFEFMATVMQEDADRLFAIQAPTGEVRLQGQANQVLMLRGMRVIPAEQRHLPSAALGLSAGGEVPVASDDPNGRKSAEPFFEVHADVDPNSKIALLHGRTGKIRFDLPPEPLLPRWIRSLRQMLQKRYQI
jgi:putative peptide zinc metalloprotease protein